MDIEGARINLINDGFEVIRPSNSANVLIIPPDGRVEFDKNGQIKMILDPSNRGIERSLMRG